MTRFPFASLLALALALPATPPLQAQASVESRPIPAEAALIGSFPAADSDAGKADLAIVLWHQRIRTPVEVQRALSEVRLGLAVYSDALGGPADAVCYPRTAALLEKVAQDSRATTDGLKRHFARPRPFQADPRVEPAIEREVSPSYPSGHATRGLLFALVLAELLPERRVALLARGRQVGVDRVIGGVHYPTDIEAGQRLGLLLAEAWLARPENRDLVDRVKAAEWSRKVEP